MASLTCQATPRGRKDRELTEYERVACVSMMLALAKDGKLPHGIITDLSQKFQCAPRTVARLWKKATISKENGVIHVKEVLSNRSERGRKPLWDRTELERAVTNVPLLSRQTYRDLAEEIDVPTTTLYRITTEEETLRRKVVYLKPSLSVDQRIARVDYCLSHEDRNNRGMFKDMYEYMMADEKWFNLMTDGRCFILGKDEPDPHITTRHKSYIGKVMFLCVVARPRVLNNGKFFDGKIGIWPFGHLVPAKNDSKNRPAGTLEWKNYSCDATRYRQFLISHVLPAMMDRFPEMYWKDANRRRGVILQQDGAGSHIKQDDEEFKEAVEELGVNVRLLTQPAQSPDLNINDLGFFASLASLTKKRKVKSEYELVKMVEEEFGSMTQRSSTVCG